MKTITEFRVQSLEFNRIAASLAALVWLCGGARAGSDPYRGLWVGNARLSCVNEVSIPIDENNVSIAPDPNVPTPTSDEAQIRLILHVNGSGQVNLLKDVAILRRSKPNETNRYFASEADLSLVTDDRLYSEFPEQEARRVASAVFDFGDYKATEAVDAIVGAVSRAVAQSIMGSVNESAAKSAGVAAADDIVPAADVAESYYQFLTTHLPKGVVSAISQSASYESDIDDLRDEARDLADNSFYNDTRGTGVLDALRDAIASAPAGEEEAAAQNAVARFADVGNLYERFVHGDVFGDMIREVSLAAATEAANTGTTRAAIDSAARGTTAYLQAGSDALNARVASYTDTASVDAIESVVTAVVDAAYAASSVPQVVPLLAAELEKIAFDAQASLRQGFPSVDIPTSDYTEFVRSSGYADAVELAAGAAARAAVDETKLDPFYTEKSIEGAARIAATVALTTVYSTAGRARKCELPLAGVFAQGSGDARLVSTISSTDAPLGSAGLTGTIMLPANHPTNPFRHRRHPDHTVGFNIERRIRLDFDGISTNALSRTGLGVERVTGVFREEIFGLHKPLGSEPSTSPIGLKVEGTFELNRISLIDTLNAR